MSENAASDLVEHLSWDNVTRMLALAPELVTMQRAEASPATSAAFGPPTPFDSASPNFSRFGSYGDLTLARGASA